MPPVLATVLVIYALLYLLRTVHVVLLPIPTAVAMDKLVAKKATLPVVDFLPKEMYGAVLPSTRAHPMDVLLPMKMITM